MKEARVNPTSRRKKEKYLAVKNLPLTEWLSIPMTDEELKAMVNTMILVWERAHERRSEAA